MEFEVSFRESIRQLTDVIRLLSEVGSHLDGSEGKAKKTASATTQAFRSIHRSFDQLNKELKKNKKNLGEIYEYVGRAEGTYQKFVESMVRGNSRATMQTAALTGKLGDMDRVLKDTAAKNAYNRWLERSSTLHAETAGRIEHYTQKLQHLRGAEAQRASVLQAQVRSQEQANSFYARQSARIEEVRRQTDFLRSAEGQRLQQAEQELRQLQRASRFYAEKAEKTENLRRELTYLNSAAGRQQQALQAEVRASQAAGQEAQKRKATLEQLRREVEYLATIEGREAARLRQVAQGRQQAATYIERQRNRLAELRRESEYLATAEGQEMVRLREANQVRQRAETYLTRQRARTEELRREIEFLDSAAGRELVTLQSQARARRQASEYIQRQQERTEQLRREAAFLASEEGRQQVALEASNRARRQAATYLENQRAKVAQLRQEAEFLASEEGRELVRLRESNRARASAETYLERQRAKTAELRREVEFLSSEEGRNQTLLQQKVRELRRGSQATEQAAASNQNYVRTLREANEALSRLTATEAHAAASQRRLEAGIQAYNAALVRNAQSLQESGNFAERYARQLTQIENALGRSSNTALNAMLAELAASGRQATASLSALSTEQAKLGAQEEALIRRLERRNQLARMRANNDRLQVEATNAQNAAIERQLVIERERQNMLEARARALSTLTQSEMRQTDEMRRQTAEYQRMATYAQMSTAQLMGLASGKDRLSRDMRASAQVAAMFRAALGGLNASIGIYTSATILAASATYAVAAAFRNTLSTGIEFTDTMARAEAVMMTGSHAISEYGRSMEGLEMQVRALGASTMFTANQVSQALTELGMAGLSANQAMAALAPTLDIAAIGNLELGRAADIATNVMTAFGRQASELAGITDILAYAITNSNTTLEQLANSLSYVGPAAHSAGFSLEQTAAAIQTLANAGIKGSRAGTGLRRVMVNLQNPTAKGAEVLDRLNISLVDGEGNTRDLTEILHQFNDAMSNHTPAERMADIVNLFGVRASQSAARLIEAAGEVSAFTREMELAEGMANQMRQTIESTVGAEWKRLVSAFNDVQLDVFDRMSDGLMKVTAQITLTIAKQQELNEEMSRAMGFSDADIADGIGITHLDVLIAELERLGKTVLWLGGTMAAFKGASVLNSMLQASSAGMVQASGRLNELGTRSMQQSAHYLNLARSGAQFTAVQRGVNVVLGEGAGIMGRATLAAGTLSSRLSTVAMAAGTWGVGILGVAGIAYTLYQSLSHAFGDTEDYVARHKDRIEELNEAYKEYNNQIQDIAHERSRRALRQRRQELEGESQALQEQIAHWQTLANAYDESTEIGIRARDRLILLGNQLDDNRSALSQNSEALDELANSHVQATAAMSEVDKKAVELARAQERLAYSQEQAAKGTRGASADVSHFTRVVSRLEEELRGLTKTYDDINERTVSFHEQMNNAVAEARAAAHQKHVEDNRTLVQEMHYVQGQIKEVRDEIAEMEGGLVSETDLNKYRELENRLLELETRAVELGYAFQDAGNTAEEAWDQLMASRRSDEENIKLAREELERLNKHLVIMRHLADTGNEIFDPEAFEEMIRRALHLQGVIEQGTRSTTRSSGRTVDEFSRQLDAMQRNFEQLRAEFDPVGVAYDQMIERQKELNVLLENRRITDDDHAAAMRQIREEYEKAVDPLADIREKLDGAQRAQDQYVRRVRRVKTALDEGTISVDEASRALKLYHEEMKDGLNTHDEYRARTQELMDAYGPSQEMENLKQALEDINERIRNDDTPENLRENYRKARENIVKEMRRLAIEADPQAKEFVRAWEEASRRIDETFADAFRGAFDSFDDFADQLLDGFKRLLAELAYQAMLRPIVVGFTQDLGGMMGIPGMGGPGAPSMLGGINQVGGNLSGIWNAVGAGGAGLGNIAWTGASNQAYSSGWAASATGGVGQSGLWGGSTANFSGATGLTSAGAGMAGSWAGNQIGTSLFGKQANSSWGATGGALIGTYFGGPVGSFIGGSIGGALDAAFGSKGTPASLRIATMAPGEMPSGQTGWEHHGRAFTSDSPFGDVGFAASGTQRLNEQLPDGGEHEFLAHIAALDQMLASLAQSEEDLLAMSEAARSVSVRGVGAQQILERLGERTSVIVGAIDGDWGDFLAGLEGSVEEIVARGTQAIQTLNLLGSSVDRLSFTFDASAGNALESADSMAMMAGGVDNLNNVIQGYFQATYSETERLSRNQQDLVSSFKTLGDEVPLTVEQLRSMVEAQNLNTEAGRELSLQLMALAPAFSQVAEEVEGALTQTYRDILGREPDAEGLKYWMDEVMSGSISLERAIELIANSTEAAAEKIATIDLGSLLSDLTESIRAERDRLSSQLSAQLDVSRAQVADLRDALAQGREGYQEIVNKSREHYQDLRGRLQEQVQAERDAHSERMSALREQESAASSAVRSTQQMLDSLRSGLASLSMGNRDEEVFRRQQARQTLQRMVGRSDIDQDEMQRAIQVLTQESRHLFASEEEMFDDFARTAHLLAELEGQAKTQLTVEERQLEQVQRLAQAAESRHEAAMDLLDRQMQAAQEQHEGYLEQLSKRWAEEQEYLEAQIAAEEERQKALQDNHDRQMKLLDKQLEEAEKAVEIAQGTWREVQSVDDALAALNNGLYEYQKTQADSTMNAARITVDAIYSVGGAVARAVGNAASMNAVPGFARGGTHMGGLRIVGEDGPELESTGPSRIRNNADTRRLLNFDQVVSELRSLRSLMSKNNAYEYESVKTLKKMKKDQDRQMRAQMAEEDSQ